MRILDRYIVRSFLVNYLLALGVLVGMYTLLDLIVNFDSFTKAAQSNTEANNATAWKVLYDIIDYYAYQFLVIFQQISGAIPLLAAGFTMVRMTRHNELTAMLAAGVSLYRVAVPIILVSVCFSMFNIVNQEMIICQDFIVQKLLRPHGGEATETVTREDRLDFVRDSDNSLLTAGSYDPKNKQLKDVRILLRDPNSSALKRRISADTATWLPNANEGLGAWEMKGAMQIDDSPDADPAKQAAGRVSTLMYTTSVTPRQIDLIFQKKAVDYLSSTQIRMLASDPMESNKGALYKVMYLRFTQPMMNIIMLLIGIPFLLTREPGRLIKNMFYCVIVTGIVFAGTFVMFSMSGKTVDPLLAAWLPVLIFGPFAVVMLDLIKT
jgi:lipopolysaccharide export system permease protein